MGGINDTVSEYSQVNSYATAYLATAAYNSSDYTYTQMDNNDYTISSQEKPAGLTLTISTAGTIYIIDETTGRGWSESVSAGTYTVYNVIPNHIYKWWVKTSTGATTQQGRLKGTGSLRMIYLTGCHNFRDLGGWACDGGTVKYGKLLRGAQLSYNGGTLATSADIARLRAWGVKCEIDMRRLTETAGQDGVVDTSDDITSSVIGSDVRYLHYPFSDASYTDIINLNGQYADLIREMVKTIVDNVIHDIPTYFHCAAGADRTGVMACMIEGLLGVSQSDQDRDYELTSYYGGLDYTRLRNTSGWKGLITYISSLTGSTWRDKFVQWFLDCGVSLDDLNAFRTACIDGTPATLVASDYTISRTITNNLAQGIITDNAVTSVTNGSAYTANLTAAISNNIAIKDVTVTMGGVDITSSVVTLTAYTPTTTHSISNVLTHVANSNNASVIADGSSYSATLTPDTDYTLDTVTITMGGVDITSTVYSSGVISIPSVTGNVIITATATQAQQINQIPISTESDGTPYNNGQGYKEGYRLNSSGQETALAGKYVTGFIPVSNGAHISFEGMSINAAAQDNNYIAFYDSSHNCLWSKYAYAWYAQTSNIVAPMTADNGNLKSITLTGGTYGGVTYNFANAAYMRVACNSIDSNSAIYIE